MTKAREVFERAYWLDAALPSARLGAGFVTTCIGLRVEFEELLAGKAGDSAGVAIATAGYSNLRQIAIRQDVAMTGSLRSDGAGKAVGACRKRSPVPSGPETWNWSSCPAKTRPNCSHCRRQY